jgi:hypothetical protein
MDTPSFSTPQSATTAVKRTLRENSISTKAVRSSRTADDRYLSCIFMPQGTSDATYAKIAAVLTEAGFKVTAYTSASWVSASSDASDR